MHRKQPSHGDQSRKNTNPVWSVFLWPAVVLVALIVALLLHYSINWDYTKKTVHLDPSKAINLFQKADREAEDTAKKKGSSIQIPTAVSSADLLKQLQARSSSLPTAKIHWVDDTPTNNQTERLALAFIGVYCDSYTSTAEALEAVRWNAANGEKPYDIIISDYERPKEFDSEQRPMTGADTYHQIRQLRDYSTTPFIFYTADHIEDAARIVASDANGAATNVPSVLLQRVIDSMRSPPVQ